MENKNVPFVVLMADDDEDDCFIVDSVFQELPVANSLHFVGDGKELLDYLHNTGVYADQEKYPKPDLILLDLNMPLIDGREVLGIIKSDPQLSEIPVLILTTSQEERDIALSRETGASSFLSKPADFEELARMLRYFCLAIMNDPNIPFQVAGFKRR